MSEQEKYETIKKLVESNGNKTRAAVKIGCSRRHINRLIKGYQEHGKAFFLHGNRGRKPAHTLSADTRQTVVDLYRTKYFDTNFTHFSELLAEQEGVVVSPSTIRNILTGEDLLSPKARRATKREALRKIEEQKKMATSKKEIAKLIEAEFLIEDPHPRRPRCAYFGEMLQMDASLHPWFGDRKATLHVAVDDATGMIVGAYFDHQETLKGYYNVFNQILRTHGIPYMFYTDRRTVFEFQQKKSPSIEEDTFTQFSYACKQLGVEIKTTSIPQAKGRVERLFQTLQSRLPIELRLAGTTTIEQANEFLNSYIKKFNARFSIPFDSTKSVFEIQPDKEKINLTLAVLAKRKIDNGHSIKFEKNYYKTVDSNGYPAYYHKGTSALVIKAFDGSLFTSIGEKIYSLELIPEHEVTSMNFASPKQTESVSKRYVPKMSHPWKQSAFSKFVEKQKHHFEQPFDMKINSQALLNAGGY
ncbi:MAG: ISNCY family transposase [Lutisporaceae bacterium]